jgi:hypothetical protein
LPVKDIGGHLTLSLVAKWVNGESYPTMVVTPVGKAATLY